MMDQINAVSRPAIVADKSGLASELLKRHMPKIKPKSPLKPTSAVASNQWSSQ